jgi:pyruvate dehydrogenase E1 component
MSSSRVCFLCYTIKGYKLPIAGHKDNHGLFLNSSQIESLRKSFGVPEGEEWAPLAGISPKNMDKVQQVLNDSFYKSKDGGKKRDYGAQAEVFKIPDMFFEVDNTRQTSTQTTFGQVLLTAAKSKDAYASRIMTMAPDVATSTNLGGFINTRGGLTNYLTN